jgi:hypothetical protein
MTPEGVASLIGLILNVIGDLPPGKLRELEQAVWEWFHGGGDDPARFAPEFAGQLEQVRQQMIAEARLSRRSPPDAPTDRPPAPATEPAPPGDDDEEPPTVRTLRPQR